MELKEFIVSVLDDITDAIKEEQKKWNPQATIHEGVMCPPAQLKSHMGQDTKREVERIHFDLLIAEEKKAVAEGGAKGRILVMSASAGFDMYAAKETAQRVSFDIPLLLPY